MSTLKDQLLRAGLTDEQSIRKARRSKQASKPKKIRGEAPETVKMAEQALRDRAVRAKQLNQERQNAALKKEQLAQVRQLIDNSKLDRENAELAYHFNIGGKIKTLYIKPDQQKQLNRNQIAIVTPSHDKFELVPKTVAAKIAQRDASYVVTLPPGQVSSTEEDNAYADYQIPDDLVW